MNYRNPFVEWPARVWRKLAVGSLGLTLLGLGGCITQPAWRDAEIGAPTVAGSSSSKNGVLRVSGGGTGESRQADQLHFTSIPYPGGDVEVVARLVAFQGAAHARAGLMVRADASPTAAMAHVAFHFQDTKTGQNALRWTARDVSPGAISQGGGVAIRQPIPLWLRLVRVGKNFAVSKSPDGKLWTPLGNVSGGQFAYAGALEVGVFVAGGGSNETASATFDNIRIGKPQLGYRTSWVGNTFGSRQEDNHVSNALAAMWVAPDGTCYASSYWDEGGQPVISYRAGQVWRALPIATPQTAEGGITGDDNHLYVAAVDHIVELNPAAPDFAPRPIVLSVNLHNQKPGYCVVSGLAANGRELFVADSRDNLIRVVTLEPVATYQAATAANNRIEVAPAPVEVPANDPRFAPALVYQTRRCGEGVRYTIPNLTPGTAYTVRAHLAAYSEKEPALGMGKENTSINVREIAGGAFKAFVKDFPDNQTDLKGNLVFAFGGYGGSLCALEILDAAGKRVCAINCGGPATGEFTGESAELVNRAFPCERPGSMTFDKRGDLWIIQRANDFPGRLTFTTKYKAAVKCYKTDGTFTGREITDVVNPRALGYDAAQDQLLVAENGTDLNVRFYTGLDAKPVLARSFGEQGGIYSGERPGLVYDPAAGGYARFAGIAGVGVDAQGNLYVGGGLQGTDLRMFTPAGQLGWRLNSLMFCNTYDVDPASDGTEIYGTYNHLQLDLSQTAPGQEQRYVGYNWDLRHYGEPIRAANSQSIVRRLGAGKRLVMFTSAQGIVDEIHIYRYDGEIAIPCGGTRHKGSTFWIDTNGNGQEEPEELTKMASPIGWVTGLCVDSKGDLWVAQPGMAGSFMRHFTFQGLTEKGVPIYRGIKGAGYEDIPIPDEGGKLSAWAMAVRLDYDADRDIMVTLYPAVARTGEGDKSPCRYFLARYDNWSKGNRTAAWKFKALEAHDHPEYFMYEDSPGPYNLFNGYMGMQIAGDYLFMADLWGTVHVFDLATGQLANILSPGPEVNGQGAWEDAAMGLRAFKRKNGEYLIFTENSGWGGKNNFYRWKPKKE